MESERDHGVGLAVPQNHVSGSLLARQSQLFGSVFINSVRLFSSIEAAGIPVIPCIVFQCRASIGDSRSGDATANRKAHPARRSNLGHKVTFPRFRTTVLSPQRASLSSANELNALRSLIYFYFFWSIFWSTWPSACWHQVSSILSFFCLDFPNLVTVSPVWFFPGCVLLSRCYGKSDRAQCLFGLQSILVVWTKFYNYLIHTANQCLIVSLFIQFAEPNCKCTTEVRI